MAVTEKPTPEVVEELEERWEDAPGIPGFFNTVDHKRIGMRYIYTAFVFFFLAGALALVMRVQLAQPNAGVLSPETYNELFTMHGTTMIFLFNTPVLAGFGNYLIPLMLGSRDMAFPRLNAFSYWIFLLSGLFLLLELPRRPPAQRRLVRLRPAHVEAVLDRHQHRLLGPRRDLRRHLHHRRRGQLHRHASSSCARRA